MTKIVTSLDIFGNGYEVSVEELGWRPAAYAIVVLDDKILLVKERGGYHLPGGGINLGETPENAVVREVKEETGMIIDNVRLVGSLSTFFALAHKRDAGITHVQSLLLYYVCDLTGGNLTMEGLEEDERQYGLEPEWVPLTALDDIPIGSTVDWRSVVKARLM